MLVNIARNMLHSSHPKTQGPGKHVHLYIYIYINIHEYYIYVYIYMSIYIYTYIYIYIQMACMPRLIQRGIQERRNERGGSRKECGGMGGGRGEDG